MGDIAIRALGLSKQYRIGARERRQTTLRDQLAHGAVGLFRRNGRPVAGEDTIWALKDVSFDVTRGEVVGVIGRNGAGKSTLLKILSRITRPTTGQAEIHGRVGSLLEVGTGFHPELTGRENIYLNGALLGMKKAEIGRKFDEIVAFAEVEKFIDTPVKRYSSGMYLRLAFGVAAHLEPEILIVDEVLAVGDMPFQRKCFGKMAEISTEGRTVLLVSHNLGAVGSLCARCVLLEAGQIALDADPESVMADYMARHEMALSGPPRTRVTGDPDLGAEFVLHLKKDAGEVGVSCGDPVRLEFDIEAPRPLAEVTAGIVLRNLMGEPVVGMSSRVQNMPRVSSPSRFWRVSCDMGSLPLNAGTYLAGVYVGKGDREVARFSNAILIRVVEKDVFGWGSVLPGLRSWGPIYWAPRWDIEPK